MKKQISLFLIFALLGCSLSGCAKPAADTEKLLLVTIDSAERLEAEAPYISENTELLELSVTLQNNTGREVEYSALKFVLQAGEASVIETVIGYPQNADTMLTGGSLKDGESASGTLIYEISPGDAYTLVYYGNGFDKEATAAVKVATPA